MLGRRVEAGGEGEVWGVEVSVMAATGMHWRLLGLLTQERERVLGTTAPPLAASTKERGQERGQERAQERAQGKAQERVVGLGVPQLFGWGWVQQQRAKALAVWKEKSGTQARVSAPLLLAWDWKQGWGWG